MGQAAFPQRTNRIDSIDGWRAISVALVIAGHLFAYSSIKIYPPLAEMLASLSRLGVQIFFVISGFVITRGFMTEFAKHGRISLSAFYVRRALRIFPPLMLYIAAIVTLAWAGVIDRESIGVIQALTFTCNLPHSDCGGLLGAHLWSLSAEEQFYLVIPFVFALLGKRVGLTYAAGGVSVSVVMLYALKFPALAAFLWNFNCIAIGVACALNEARIRETCNGWPTWLWGAAAVAVALIWIAPASIVMTIAKTLLIGPLIAFVLMQSSSNGVLSSAPLRYIGRISYGIYLVAATRDVYLSIRRHCLLRLLCEFRRLHRGRFI